MGPTVQAKHCALRLPVNPDVHMMKMTDKKRQGTMLGGTFWLLVISWLSIPFAAFLSHVSYYIGNGIISLLSLCAVILSVVGMTTKSTRTGWFVLSLILALLTLLYGVKDIRFPVQS